MSSPKLPDTGREWKREDRDLCMYCDGDPEPIVMAEFQNNHSHWAEYGDHIVTACNMHDRLVAFLKDVSQPAEIAGESPIDFCLLYQRLADAADVMLEQRSKE